MSLFSFAHVVRAGVLGMTASLVAASAARAQTASPPRRAAPSDSVAVASVASRFHSALAGGDSATALALLAADVVILESGDIEQREEYRRHHLPEDIAFARAIPGTRTVTGVTIVGDVAWVTATSAVQGQFKGRAISSAGAELMVLSRVRRAASDGSEQAPAWQIRAIHWSSRRRGA